MNLQVCTNIPNMEGKQRQLLENIERRETKLNHLQSRLSEETNEVERAKLESIIRDHLEQIQAFRSELQDVAGPSGVTRRSERHRRLTPKMRDFRGSDIAHKETMFLGAYERLRASARELRSVLKSEYDEEVLTAMKDKIEGFMTEVDAAYESLRSLVTPSKEVQRRVDTSQAVTDDIVRILKKE